MKYTLTIQEMPDSMLKVDFDPPVHKILEHLTRTQKCTAAEEMVLRLYEFIQGRSIKEERARKATASKIILPTSSGVIPKFN